MRAGFAPSSAMSANTTWSASSPRRGAQEVDLLRSDRDHDRLAGGHRVADERRGPVDERVGAVVEHRLVAEGSLRH